MEADLVRIGRTGERAIPSKGRRPFSILKCPWSLREWVEQNLPIELDESWMVTLQRFDATASPYHIDALREWSYNYLIYGHGARTHWREEMNGKIVESVEYKKSKWYFHNGSIPHGVTNIPRQRVAVTIFKFEENKAGSLYSTAPKLSAAFRDNPYFYYI